MEVRHEDWVLTMGWLNGNPLFRYNGSMVYLDYYTRLTYPIAIIYGGGQHTYYKRNSPIRPTRRHIRPGRNTTRRSICICRSYTETGIRPGRGGKRPGPGSTAATAAGARQSCCRRSPRLYRRRTSPPARPICRRTWPRRCTTRIRADIVRRRIET